jgi:RNA polymerase sigma-70 factor (ECF subfamily)
MLAVREGDLDRMGPVFDRNHKHLYNFFVRMTDSRRDSEDLVQEVFLRMLHYRHTYRDDSLFPAWMFQIARNVRIDYHKRRTGDIQPLENQMVVSPDENPEETAVLRNEMDLLDSALAMLDKDKREVILLSRFEGMRFRDIARLLGVKETTVKVRAHRAVQELGELFEKLTNEGV